MLAKVVSDPMIDRHAIFALYAFKISVVASSVFISYLGYKLYTLGFTKGNGKVEFKSKFGKFIATGQGPGFLFMACGTAILLTALLVTNIKSEKKPHSPGERQMGKQLASEQPGMPPDTNDMPEKISKDNMERVYYELIEFTGKSEKNDTNVKSLTDFDIVDMNSIDWESMDWDSLAETYRKKTKIKG